MELLTTIHTWLYDNLPVGVALLDRDLVYRYVNASYAATQGLAAPQLVDRPLSTGQPDWTALLERLVAQARESGRAVEEYDVTLTYPRQPSLHRTWDVTLLPLFDQHVFDGAVLYLLDVTTRQEAEQLHVSETRLRSVLDVAADAILVIDENGTIITCNPATTRIFGYPREELVGRPVTTIMPDSYGVEHQRFLERYLHTGVPHIIGTVREVQGRRRDGAVFPCELSIAESREASQRRIFVGIIRDITERKRVEEELRTFSSALEQSANIVVITDVDGRIQYVNPKFTEITGYTREEALGQKTSILKSGETPRSVYDALWETIRTGGEWRGEFHNRKKNGELYWEYASISPIRDAQGAITHFLAIKEDINERKRLQAELENARARLEAIIDTVPLPLFVVETEGEISIANEAAHQFYGRALHEGNIFRMTRLHPDTRTPWPSSEWPIMRALREGQPVTDVEQLVIFPDGREVPVLVHAAPVIVEGRVIAAVGVSQDLTQLKAADRAKDTFLALITHELRSPLTTIISWADLARKDAEIREEALDVILRSAQVQQRIIGDLLDVSRLLYGKLLLESEPLDAWEVVRRATEAMRGTIEGKELTLRLRPPGEPLPVLADPVRLEQVINNLLTNAMKFTPAGGEIEVSGARDGHWARLCIRDTGYGIPPEQIPYIFQRFQQMGRERISGGLGLGLAIVRGLVELHHGRIQANSPGVDEGATFTVWLPLREE
jgi:PAS domain S-box-containing protein